MPLRLLTRNTWPCVVPGRPRGAPAFYVCSLPDGHRSDHEARAGGRTVYRWPRRRLETLR